MCKKCFNLEPGDIAPCICQCIFEDLEEETYKDYPDIHKVCVNCNHHLK